MFFRLAWKNIWRNRLRSLVVIFAVASGLWAAVFVNSFYQGIMKQRIDDVISLEMSHFQFHSPGFRDDLDPSFVIRNGGDLVEELLNDVRIKAVSMRVVAMGMMASPTRSGGVKVNGVQPGQESSVTTLAGYIEDGEFLTDGVRHPALISRKLADRYGLKLKSKIVITVQDVHKDISSAAFRVGGIYNSTNGMFDDMNIFVRYNELSALLDVGDDGHEIAVLLDEHTDAISIAEEYQSMYPELSVESWMDLSTGMRFMVEAMDSYMVIIVGIVLLALLFGIVNTMLMSILERTREIGMLMCVGMSRGRIFSMIIMETLLLSATGGPLGILLAWLTVGYFNDHGIDLGPFAQVYQDLGYAPVIYPLLDLEDIIMVSVMVLVMAVIASIFPAYKGLRLKPVEALNKI